MADIEIVEEPADKRDSADTYIAALKLASDEALQRAFDAEAAMERFNRDEEIARRDTRIAELERDLDCAFALTCEQAKSRATPQGNPATDAKIAAMHDRLDAMGRYVEDAGRRLEDGAASLMTAFDHSLWLD